MRTIQDYQSFTSYSNEEAEINAFESACLEEGLELNEGYYSINEEEKNTITDMIAAAMKNAAAATATALKSVDAGVKSVEDALKKGTAKDSKEAFAALAKAPAMETPQQVYISTLEKLLAQAKKNTVAYATPGAKQSLANLLHMSASAAAKIASNQGIAKMVGGAAAGAAQNATKTIAAVGKAIANLF